MGARSLVCARASSAWSSVSCALSTAAWAAATDVCEPPEPEPVPPPDPLDPPAEGAVGACFVVVVVGVAWLTAAMYAAGVDAVAAAAVDDVPVPDSAASSVSCALSRSASACATSTSALRESIRASRSPSLTCWPSLT